MDVFRDRDIAEGADILWTILSKMIRESALETEEVIISSKMSPGREDASRSGGCGGGPAITKARWRQRGHSKPLVQVVQGQ